MANPVGFVFLSAALALPIGASLTGLGLLLPALLPERVRTARDYLRPGSVGMGFLHLLVLLILVTRSEGRPLVGLVSISWFVFAMLCIAIGLASWVQHVGSLLWPEVSKGRRTLGSAMVIAWACAFPLLGQVLGMGLIFGAYGAGLAAFTKKRRRVLEEVPQPGALSA